MRFAWMIVLAACAAHPSEPATPAGPTIEVGTATYTLIDQTRRDPIDATRPRTWIVQLYYPSEPTPLAAHYADDPALIEQLVARQYYEATAPELRGWLVKPGFAEPNAPAKRGTWPVITLSPGLAFARLNYAELAAHLVARGYVVAVVDHPYLGISHVGARFTQPDDDPALQSDDPADALPRVREWTRDLSVVLDDLQRTTHVPGLALDLHRAIATGHSIGGTAAVGACDDPRFRGCMDFEGFLEGIDSLAHGAHAPVFAGFSRAKGRPATLQPGQADPMDAIRARLAAAGQPVWTAKITGGSHTSFSDCPDVLPRTLSRFGGELMSPARSFEVYTTLVDAFARGTLPAALPTLPEAAAHP